MTTLIPGKFYVCDIFSARDRPPVSGPFDSAELAEADRRELNIDGDCIVAKAITNTRIEIVQIEEQDQEPLPTYASFWVYDSPSEAHVKFLLNTKDNTGEENAVTEARGGHTEEGSHHTDELWYFDIDDRGRLVIVHEHHTDATDCDGRIESHNVYECTIENLEAGRPICHYWHANREAQPIPGLFYPAWEKRRDGSYQRDHATEAAGY